MNAATVLRSACGAAPVGCVGGAWTGPAELPLAASVTASATASARGGRTLVGGIGYRWQTDASFGLYVTDLLATLPLPPAVEAMDLSYGALYAALDLQALKAQLARLILVAGVARGRERGRLYRYHWQPVAPDPEELQERIREAGSGLVHPDHLLLIGEHFDALPDAVEVWELEPVDDAPGDRLTDEAEACRRDLCALLSGVDHA